MKPIAIACGDHRGVGPEVTAKAVLTSRHSEPGDGFVLIGEASRLRRELERAGRLERVPEYPEFHEGLSLHEPHLRQEASSGGQSPSDTALAALEYLRFGSEGCARGEFSALVTAPVSKEAILRAGVAFVGQTEFLATLTGTPEVTMMLLGDDTKSRWLRVSLATTHLPLCEVPTAVTETAVFRAIRQSVEACALLGLPRARIGVCGLNPHAGEGGLLGAEEGRVIAPAIARARSHGMDVQGPLSADTLFHAALEGAFDVVVAMYHDQGLPPLKVVAFETGVNWTLGLPFPRTSPDHGTAFDIAGKGIANPSSMAAAIRLARRLAEGNR